MRLHSEFYPTEMLDVLKSATVFQKWVVRACIVFFYYYSYWDNETIKAYSGDGWQRPESSRLFEK